MRRSKQRILFGTAAALAIFGAGILGGFLVDSSASGGVRAAERIWTEKANATPINPGRPTGFAQLAKAVSPAVVNISITRKSNAAFKGFGGGGRGPFFDFFKKFFRGLPKKFRKNRGVGTGFVIHPKGYILTNNHVVEKAEEIKVKFPDDREFVAKVIGRDPKTDLALIKISASEDLPVIPLGDSDKMQVGDWVLAVGNPFGLQHTVTSGIVSAKGRRGINPGGRSLPYADFIQTDASINPGNSGGPLINMRGEVIGINTAINAAGQGIGFAIPVNMAKVLLPQLKERGSVQRSWIGIHIQPVTRSLAKSFGLGRPRGALVADIVPGAPADEAGIKAGDVILEFNGQRIRKHSDLPWLASTAGVGSSVGLKILRQGKEMNLRMTLGEHPGDDGGKKSFSSKRSKDGTVKGLGLTVSNVTGALRKSLKLGDVKGVVVTNLQESSEASDAGVREKDVILKVNFKTVQNVSDFSKAVSGIKSGDPVNFYLRRGKNHLWVAFVKK